jgi:branched-chain amino acid transport system substrate-binding protein
VPELLAKGDGRMPVYQVACNHSNHEGRIGQLASRFRQQTGEDLVVFSSFDGMVMLLQGIAQARSARAADVAARMSGLRFQGFDGPVQLRADDHQLQKGVYISRWQKVDARHPRGAEGTGYTFVPIRRFEPDQITGPVRCRMQRP